MVAALLVCTGAMGQRFDKEHLGVSAGVRGNHMLDALHIYDRLINSYDYASGYVSVTLSTNPADSCRWARAFNYPRMGFGFAYDNMGSLRCREGSSLGDMYTLFGFAQFDFVRTRVFSMGPVLELGLTWTPKKWDPVTNPRNSFVGTNVIVLVGAGLETVFHLTPHWDLGAQAMICHRSNGMTGVPNRGLNQVEAGLFAHYNLSAPYTGRRPYMPPPEFSKGLCYDIYFSGGVHSCDVEYTTWLSEEVAESDKWSDFRKWPRLNLGFDICWRYHPIFSTGVGADLFYTGNCRQLEKCNRLRYGREEKLCPIYAGVWLLQEVRYRNLALMIGFGAYVYKKLGPEDVKWNYQRAGLRYYIPKAGNMFLGFDMKAHSFDRSDELEFFIGKRF